jgi:hypothetical protein
MARARASAAVWDTNGPTKVIMITPPFLGSRRRIASGKFRVTSVRARHEEWDEITGAADTSSAWPMTSGEVWARSTSIPRRFISRTTSRPNAVRPPWRRTSLQESAQSRVTLWVSVMYRTPRS